MISDMSVKYFSLYEIKKISIFVLKHKIVVFQVCSSDITNLSPLEDFNLRQNI